MADHHRSLGTTKSERRLAALAEESFLDLWSYPNVFRDVPLSGGRTMGKEVADLLVVCGDNVLIFSDKTVAWPKTDDVNVAWRRWYAQAIGKSAKQVRGAERWIARCPERLFLDAKCTSRLPLKLPPASSRKVHSIVVASGAAGACRNFFGEGSGSLVIKPDVTGDVHLSPSNPLFSPFVVGDVEPSGPFIHVFDEVSLNVVLRELDTISDFVEYLERKAELARSGRLDFAAGEEELLAWYLTGTDKRPARTFSKPGGGDWKSQERIVVAGGHYARLREHPQYIAKKAADDVSYVWDDLIKAFTKHIIGDSLEAVTQLGGRTTDTHKSGVELGVRYMAHESRFRRRLHGQAILDALKRPTGAKQRFFRAMMPNAGAGDTGFGILLLPYPKEMRDRYNYTHYRTVRSNMLLAYAMNITRKHKHLKRFVGIAMEPAPQKGEYEGSSEDMVFFEPVEWTPEMTQEAIRLQEHFDIVREGRAKEYPAVGQE